MKRMRRNSSLITEGDVTWEPYNPFYESFKTIFSTLFANRLPPDQRTRVYVPVPEIERQLDGYVSSTRDCVAILHGFMGCGKSSVLANYAKGHPNRVYLDFAESDTGMPAQTTAFAKGDRDLRRALAHDPVAKRLHDHLTPWAEPHAHRINTAFFDFLRKHHSAEIGPAALVHHSDNEKNEFLISFFKTNTLAAMRCFIEYIAHHEKYDHFLIIADNVDEQSLDTVEALFLALSNLIEYLCQPLAIYGGDIAASTFATRFRAILACRTHTFRALYNDRQGLIHTRASKEIKIPSSPSLFSKILRHRADSLDLSRMPQEGPYILPNGSRVTRKDALQFIRIFCDQLSTHLTERRVYDLLNYDYSWLMRHMKCFIQNRYFLDFDSVMLAPDPSVSLYRVFTLFRILRSMGYGNPASPDQLYYPAFRSNIPNILDWNPEHELSFYAVIKLMQWLRQEYGVAKTGCPVSYVLDMFERRYGIDQASITWAIKFAHAKEIVFAGSGRRASLQPYDEIYIAPRCGVLLDIIFESDLLFEMYKDDLCSPTGDAALLEHRPQVPIMGKPSRELFQDHLIWLKECLDEEYSILTRMDSTALENTLQLFGGNMITANLLQGVENSMDWYKKVVTDEDVASLRRLMAQCQSAIKDLQNG